MKTYKLSWGAVLLIGIVLWIFEGLSKLMGLALVVISLISLFKDKDQVHVSVGMTDSEKKE